MADHFFSCDWGTSRFRLRLVRVTDGVVLDESHSDEGVASFSATTEHRAQEFRSVLDHHIGKLIDRSDQSLSDLSVLISGMAGSSIGWCDMPYSPLPFSLDGTDVTWRSVSSQGKSSQVSDIFLLSGARSDSDVMRGEEIEAIGIGKLPTGREWLDEAVLILPGTHSKHIRTAGGQIVTFQTHMTGELFNLLTRHSSLQHSTKTQEVGRNGVSSLNKKIPDAFYDGVKCGQEIPLSAALFQVRASQLLQGLEVTSGTAMLSGLLIGSEITSLSQQWTGDCPIILCAGRKLSQHYQIALETAGLGNRLRVVPPEDVNRLSVWGQLTVLERMQSPMASKHGRLRVDGAKETADRGVRRNVRCVFDWKRFKNLPIVGILRDFSLQEAELLVQAAWAGGLLNVEVTMNTPDAAQQIKRLCELFGDRLNIGAGTVCTLEDFRVAIEAGATFMVTPAVVPEVISAGVAVGIPVFAGAATPSEMLQAWRLGASMVKVFPADQLGPEYMRSVKGPLPQIPLMPVGGVTVDSIPEYKQAGAEAFGVGNPLFSKTHVASGDWQWITEQAKRFAEAFAFNTTVDAEQHSPQCNRQSTTKVTDF